jgi:hypothetical protein
MNEQLMQQLIEGMNAIQQSNLQILSEMADVKDRLTDLEEGQVTLTDRISRSEQSTFEAIIQLEQNTNSKFDSLEQSTNARFDSLEQSTNARFDSLEQSINARFDNTNARFDKLELKFDSLEKNTNARFNTIESSINTLISTDKLMNYTYQSIKENHELYKNFLITMSQRITKVEQKQAKIDTN